jgi:hypothetical protein
MARGPRLPYDVYSSKDLAEVQSRLSTMGTSSLQDFYRSTPSYAGSGPGTSLARRRFKSWSPSGSSSGNGGSLAQAWAGTFGLGRKDHWPSVPVLFSHLSTKEQASSDGAKCNTSSWNGSQRAAMVFSA